MSRIVLSEQHGRKLSQVTDDKFWDSLPKELIGMPVYFRYSGGAIEIWPRWNTLGNDRDFYPNIWVSP